MAFGVIARIGGDPQEALARFAKAHRYFTESGYEWGLASARYYAGEAVRDIAEAEPDRLAEAVELIREGLRAYWLQGDNWGAGGGVSALACVAAKLGDDERAARLFGAADALLGKIGAFLPPTDLDAYRLVADEVRARLGTRRFDAAFADGQVAAPEEMVRDALTRIESNWSQASEHAVRSSPHFVENQWQMIQDFAAGWNIKEVSRLRGTKLSTNYETAKRICEKLGLKKWTEIGPYAIGHGLVAPDRQVRQKPGKPRDQKPGN